MKKPHSQKASTAIDSLHSTSTASQCQRLLAALEQGPVTTFDARDNLNIVCPAARILDLKGVGHEITKTPVALADRDGRLHRGIARYVLLRHAQEVNRGRR